MIKKSAGKFLDKFGERFLRDIDGKITDTNNKVSAIEKNQWESTQKLDNLIAEQQRFQLHNMYGNILHISDREVATKIFNGFIMFLDPRDIAINIHILLEGIWERWVTIAWVRILESLNKDAVVLDIGANNGYFGMLAARELDKRKAKVVLFEPNPKLLYYIHKTLSVNWLNGNTTVEQVGVSDKKGTAKLNVLKDFVGSSSMHDFQRLKDYYIGHNKTEIAAEETVDVPTITIDEYCRKSHIKAVDLVIMDIEGFEEKAYAGMRQTVAKSPNLILFIEFTVDGYTKPEAFYGQLKQDFGHVYTIDAEGNLVSPKHASFQAVAGAVEDYIMLVFSKKDLLKKAN